MDSQLTNVVAHNDALSILHALENLVLLIAEVLFKEESQRKNKATPLRRKAYLPQTAGPCAPITALRVIYLAALSHAQIRQNRLLTKRDVYYMCPVLFPNVAVVDRALMILSEQIGVHRNDLNIVAAPKGLVAGNICFIEEDAQAVNVGMFETEGCLIPARPERMLSVTSDAQAVLVVEKETVYRSLLSEPDCKPLLESFVFVTGKGYPDFATRAFLERASQCHNPNGKRIPMFLLTDADPHGINIAYCYLRQLSQCNIRWLGVRPSDAGHLFVISESSLLETTDTEHVLVDHMLKRLPSAKELEPIVISELVRELHIIREHQVKFEMEALAAMDFESNRSGLLRYLLQQVDSYFGYGL